MLAKVGGDAVQQTLFVSRCRGICARYPRNVSLKSSILAFPTASVTGDVQFRRRQQIQGGRHGEG